MNEIDAFIEACAKQKRLLGIPRMLWAFHKLYEVEDVNHPGAVEFRAACFASAENKALQVDVLARNAVDAVRRAKYDPAMLFELAEAAGSWERFNDALRKNLPALRAAAAMSERQPPPPNRKQTGLEIWNASDDSSWSDVCKAINGTSEPDQDEIDRVRQEITTHAKKNNLELRKKTAGRKRKNQIRESEF